MFYDLLCKRDIMLKQNNTSIVAVSAHPPTQTPHQEYLVRGSLKDQARKLFLKSLYTDIPDNELTTNWIEETPIRTKRHIEAHIVVIHLAPDTISYGIPTFDLMFLKKLGAMDSLEKITEVIITIINRENNKDSDSKEYVSCLVRTLQFIERCVSTSIDWSKVPNELQPTEPLVLTINEKKDIIDIRDAWLRSPPSMKSAN